MARSACDRARKMERVSVIVPCYNEEKNVEIFYKAITEDFAGSNYELELVFVNDGSSDGTKEALKRVSSNEDCIIKVINFSRNFGKESAMYAGFNNVTGEYTAVIDADMQQDPRLLLKMLEAFKEDPEIDAVAFYQEARKENPIIKFFKNKFYKIINSMSDVEFVSGASDFRMFRRRVVDSILRLSEKTRFSKGIFSWVGYNTRYLPYTANERMYGESKWPFVKLVKYALSGMVSFSTAPLNIATFLGMLASFASIVYLLIVIIQKLFFGIAVEGYATIVVLILFLGGVQLLCLGIIGEYLARVFIEAKNRPVYLVRDKYLNRKCENDDRKD